MRKSHRNKSKKRNGGGATVMPLSYYNPGAAEPAADAGRDLLKAMAPIGVRPKIGGRRSTRSMRHSKKRHTRRHHRTRKTRGGFVPSVMDSFVVAASKYIVPLALFAGYKLMTKKGKKSSKHGYRHSRRH